MQQQRTRVVVVGGGTGSFTTLRSLKPYAEEYEITAIITMADSGGSTGRLRDEFGQLPVGDARMALAALAAEVDAHDELVRELFLYRFAKGEGLTGHNFGNLLLTALTDILGSEVAAIAAASRILRVSGTVVPVTTDHAHLQATYDDGVVLVGEHTIDEPPADRYDRRIVDLALTPTATLSPAAAAALAAADVIIFGPGDLYTSILANCVVAGFQDTLRTSRATLIYLCNLMSKPGQTNGLSATQHVAEVTRYAGRMPDHVVIHNGTFEPVLLERYAQEGTYPIVNVDEPVPYTLHAVDIVAHEAVKTQAGDVLTRSLIRHDSKKLATLLRQIIT